MILRLKNATRKLLIFKLKETEIFASKNMVAMESSSHVDSHIHTKLFPDNV